MANYVGTYLNDHLAGATVGRELSKRAAGSNSGTPLGEFLEKLHEEIVEDRRTLLEVMGALDGERIGRLKPNGNLLSYSPLSRVVELEGLALGVQAKAGLWRALALLDDPRVEGFDFAALESRAKRQHRGIEGHRIEAARIAFDESG
jgi:hypothetical protein